MGPSPNTLLCFFFPLEIFTLIPGKRKLQMCVFLYFFFLTEIMLSQVGLHI